jgi:hypothetical protein
MSPGAQILVVSLGGLAVCIEAALSMIRHHAPCAENASGALSNPETFQPQRMPPMERMPA